MLLSCDYSQVELRLLAHVSQDPELLGAFHRGEDIHASTAAAIFGVPLAEVTYAAAQPGQGDQLWPDVRHVRALAWRRAPT